VTGGSSRRAADSLPHLTPDFLRTGVSTREESFGLKHLLRAKQRSLPTDHDPSVRAERWE